MEHLEQMWIVTERMAGEVKKAGHPVGEVISLLRSAKAVLNECRLNKQVRGELLPRASALIEDAQRELFQAAKPLGTDFTDRWSGEIKKVMAGEKVGEFKAATSSKFYSNMPRNTAWVRVEVPKSAKKELKKIGKNAGVKMRPDGDSHVIIMGEKESIRKALDEMAPYFKEKK